MGRLNGTFNLVGGLWPLVHMKSFEAVLGPKVDRWLVCTVGGLLTSVGYTQWRASTPDDWRHARRMGISVAGTLLVVDVVNVSRGRLRWTYLLDAAGQTAVILGWVLAGEET